ncbi:hypothetical protein QBC46DRAFT_437187 [Diplogelasinospora grovesii]|uniref:Uncharacterized protein n=1 Tax=Diplogelasinospora grovesii TaxID=303347 RepID=A0AAN6N5J6_9PEZI|nr:hypothetical protein QBC46DRAFT_437187 [Diplogelasinospora grovesii]
MTPPTPNESPSPNPTTPRRASAIKQNGETTTTPPANNRASAQAAATPKSAPAAAASQGSQRKKPVEPTLLGDFLLGRPSPARVAAQRSASKQRRKSMGPDAAAVREELRQEMRAAAVRKLQQPGGVHDRVKQWQKANVAAMKAQGGGVPAAEDVASEPTEIAVHIDAESVTEEDRVRIKMRQKPKKKKPKVVNADDTQEKSKDDADADADDKQEGKTAEERPDVITMEPRPKIAPKKRIVSDDNWMKRRRGKSPPRASPARPKAEGSPTPIPKDFLQRTAQNPTVQNKIKDWAKRVEIPDPVTPKVKKYHHTKSGEMVTVEEDEGSELAPAKSDRSEPKPPVDDGIRVKPMKPRKPQVDADDGIRIKPMRKKEPPDDGIRVRPCDDVVPDDGIRIRPSAKTLPDDGIRVRPSRQEEVEEESAVRAASSRQFSRERSTRVPSTRQESSADDVIEVIEEAATEVDTPTRRKGSSYRKAKRRSPSPTTVTQSTVTQTEMTSDDQHSASGDDDLPSHHGDSDGSERPPTVQGNKSLADIPFGYSAFSVLDLSLGADARNTAPVPKRPKAQRNPSFKAVPKVFKKVVSGAKEIIHEAVDPPRHVVNQPPSIESWLDKTVDPFVESSPKKQSVEKEWAQESHKRSSPGPQKKDVSQPPPLQVTTGNQGNADPQQEDSDATPKKGKTPATPTSSLKRSKATKSASSPLKTTSVKKPFREVLKEAFRGESGGHKLPPTIYPSCEADPDTEPDYDEEDERHYRESRRRSSGSDRRSASPDPSSTVGSSQVSTSTATPYPRRKPPTNGVHELSTIVSEQLPSVLESDTLSSVSQTTITQTTGFTGASDISRSTYASRQRSQRSGLKRRLTKHSDLVSVLSLPNDGQLVPPSRSRSIKSSRSLHRKPSKVVRGRLDDLLDEFADDEHFYLRELKTLVDGVVPVLLKQVVYSDADSTADCFTQTQGSKDKKTDTMAKSVIDMGIALEKLRNYHRRVPLNDIRHLLPWLEAVSPIYDNYLDVWRLGFQDLIVNLAPAAGRPDDEDSLLNALPRNEEGDIVGEDGERVDVAHLLKRPLIRVKWMTKFLRAAVTVMATHEVEGLLAIYERLQEKARKRHREETARITDEDANNTDTTRARDLRTLAPLESVAINQTRQVAAKDSFALDLHHSSGQRLECQVELIHRDNLDVPTDKGDILIRDISSSARSWLLFSPIAMENISARRDSESSVVVMVRGSHDGDEWFELLKLSTNSDEQIADWLQILGSDPLPPTTPPKAAMATRDSTPRKSAESDVPVGERRPGQQSPASSPVAEKPKTPSRYRPRPVSMPSAPVSPSPSSPAAVSPSPDRTPTRETRRPVSMHGYPVPDTPIVDQSPPVAVENVHRDPSKTPYYREDGAPPPPIHRTLGPTPVDLAPAPRVKRRGSSPLKHEYHPSDISSDSSSHSDDSSESASESSSDELDEDDVPDTIPGYSLKEPKPSLSAESVVSVNSITPSHSASQIGFSTQGKARTEPPAQRFVASVSYWSNKKGIWKDISSEPSSIVVHPGSMEVHRLINGAHPNPQAFPLQSSRISEVDNRNKAARGDVPLVGLILTPVVMIRRSTVLDLEVRGRASPESRLKIDSAMYRFRAASQGEAKDLYEAVHQSRLNNARYIQLSEEARFRSFGQHQAMDAAEGSGDGSTSSRRRSWFGRKNSYRASTRAPSVSQGSTSSTAISASSFLRRLMGGGNTSFNIDKSSVDKHSRPGSVANGHSGGGGGGGGGSLYTSSASSSGGGGGGYGSSTPPRSASISLSGSGSQSRWSNGLQKPFSPERPLEIRCHLNVQSNRWADKGDCILTIGRPPPGVRQELRLYHGMEKRVIVTHASKKDGDNPIILLDAVLGSKCFSMLGTKGIMCSVWEQLRDEEGNVGVAPRTGAIAGKVTKWCFQCKSVQQANWIMGMVTSEVPGVILN